MRLSAAGWMAVVAVVCSASAPAFAAGDLDTSFGNSQSVARTRHNMTQRQPGGPPPYGELMDTYRNNYGEVCVYCHTPHGASPVALPLWNRTIEAQTYQQYSSANSSTMTQPVTPPGITSLACLSCHDGQTAIDSVINMPGSGRYLASQANSVSMTFLSQWAPTTTFVHANLTECMSCHSPGPEIYKFGATDFTAAVLGTDLRDDHPIGVLYPTGNPDFKPPTATHLNVRFFDTNSNGRPDKSEIRMYNSGDGFEVECASCHDPHGVPSGGPGSRFLPTFLRVSNAGSALCLSCHTK